MHITIDNVSQFRDQFRQMGRSEQFSYEALELLYEFLEEVSPEAELDVISLCCEFSEDSKQAIRESHGLEEDANVFAYLEECTLFVGVTASGNVVYQQF